MPSNLLSDQTHSMLRLDATPKKGDYRLDGQKGAFSWGKGLCKGHKKRCKGRVQGPRKEVQGPQDFPKL